MLGLIKGSVASTPVTNVEAVATKWLAFTIRNDGSLHARPAAVLVQTVKPFSSKISVEKLDRNTAPASAKKCNESSSTRGKPRAHRLRFVAGRRRPTSLIEALQQAIINGLGESVSFVPAVADTIESIAVSAIPAEETATVDANTKEAAVIKNEHGLHAHKCGVGE